MPLVPEPILLAVAPFIIQINQNEKVHSKRNKFTELTKKAGPALM